MIFFPLIAKGVAVLVILGACFGAYKIVTNFIDGALQDKADLAVAVRVVEEKKAAIAYLEAEAQLEQEYQIKKSELIEATNEKLSEAREREQEAHNQFTASRLEELSNKKQSEYSTVTVNERLTNRAAKATRKKLNRLESLSDWNYGVSAQPVTQ